MRNQKPYLKIVLAASVVGLVAYLIWEHQILATLGSYVWRLVMQFGEFLVRFIFQFWEFMVRSLEVLWRPLLLFLENLLRGMATRPFGKFFAWFFAGITLRYLLGPRVRTLYARATGYAREQGSRIGAWWSRLPFSLRVAVIVVGAGTVAVFNVGLLLLPLGFFIEPIYRYIRNWVARESLERTPLSKRFNNWVYRQTRALMRESPLFRRCLWPLRYRRLIAIRQARKLHFEYRRKGEGLRDMLEDVVRRGKPPEETEKRDKPGSP